MRCIDLLDEIEFRGLEVDSQEKSYLLEVLLIDDEAYAELMSKLGNHHEAMEFAQGEVAHWNQELRRQRAVTEAARGQFMRKSNEDQPKGKKRVCSTEEDEEVIFKKKKRLSAPEDTFKHDTPVEKVKPSRIANTNCQPTTPPQAMQARINKKPSLKNKEPAIAEPAKGVAVKIARKKGAVRKSSYARNLTRSTHKGSKDEEMQDIDQESEEESDDDFIVNDLAYKPKGKSKVGAMARSNLFAGLR